MKRLFFRRIAAFCCAAVMLVSLAACSGVDEQVLQKLNTAAADPYCLRENHMWFSSDWTVTFTRDGQQTSQQSSLAFLTQGGRAPAQETTASQEGAVFSPETRIKHTLTTEQGGTITEQEEVSFVLNPQGWTSTGQAEGQPQEGSWDDGQYNQSVDEAFSYLDMSLFLQNSSVADYEQQESGGVLTFSGNLTGEMIDHIVEDYRLKERFSRLGIELGEMPANLHVAVTITVRENQEDVQVDLGEFVSGWLQTLPEYETVSIQECVLPLTRHYDADNLLETSSSPFA